MSRYAGPKCRLCRREGVKLLLKGARCETAKCPIDKGSKPPGTRGARRRGRPSPYGIRLREKQKCKRFYGVTERQFRRYFEEAARQNMDRLRLPDGKEGPDRVVNAIVAALLDPEPKPRSLVVSNQRDAEVSLRSHIRKLAQLNEGHEFSYTRDQLVEMLDAALAEAGRTSDPNPGEQKRTPTRRE